MAQREKKTKNPTQKNIQTSDENLTDFVTDVWVEIHTKLSTHLVNCDGAKKIVSKDRNSENLGERNMIKPAN